MLKYLIFLMLLTGVEAVYSAQRDKESVSAEQEQIKDMSHTKKMTDSISIYGKGVDIGGFDEPYSEAVFVSEYTRISPSETGKTSQNGFDFSEFIDAETKSDIKAFAKEIKDPIKLKALEYGLTGADQLNSVKSPDEQFISGYGEQNHVPMENKSASPIAQWERERKQQGLTKIENSYDEEAAKAFYGRVKTIAIVFVI